MGCAASAILAVGLLTEYRDLVAACKRGDLDKVRMG